MLLSKGRASTIIGRTGRVTLRRKITTGDVSKSGLVSVHNIRTFVRSGSGFTVYAEEKSNCRMKMLARPLGRKINILFNLPASTKVSES